ncbi:DAK2 domain-containing protein [Teichococcus aestuarii]
MARGAAALRALPEGAHANPAEMLAEAGQALRRAIAGSSGPFYAVALLRAARALEGQASPDAAAWAGAFRAAADAIGALGGARAGDRTMLDALLPAAEAFEQSAGQGLGPAWGRRWRRPRPGCAPRRR